MLTTDVQTDFTEGLIKVKWIELSLVMTQNRNLSEVSDN